MNRNAYVSWYQTFYLLGFTYSHNHCFSIFLIVREHAKCYLRFLGHQGIGSKFGYKYFSLHTVIFIFLKNMVYIGHMIEYTFIWLYEPSRVDHVSAYTNVFSSNCLGVLFSVTFVSSHSQTMFVDLDANMDCEVTLEEYMNEMSKKDAKART